MYQVTTLQRIKRDPNMADETEYIKLKVFFSSSKLLPSQSANQADSFDQSSS